MRNFIAKAALAALCICTVFSARAAGKVTFEASAPMVVATGEAFRVEFTVNASPDEGTFAGPDFEGFELLAGPVLSTGRYFEAVNGSMSSSVTATYTYMVVCAEPGTRTIGAASVAVDGKTYRTRPVPVEAVAEPASDTPAPGAAQSGGGAERLEKDDVLLRAAVSRTSVFKGEPLHVTVKLYRRVNIAGFEDVKLPSFNGFWVQELPEVAARGQRETLGGKVYETAVLKEYLLYPQLAGRLTVDPVVLTAVAQIVVPGRSHDPFFGGPELVNVRVPLRTQPLSVEVRDLPAGAPESFGGAVGRFTLDATLPPDRLTANSSANYAVRIAGRGNLAFVQAPKLTLPGSFEQYNARASESIDVTASGMTGYRRFEYPFIARAAGEYEIPGVEFTYFDPSLGQYVTLESKAAAVEVLPDGSDTTAAGPVLPGRGLTKEEVKLLGQDIRFIKLGGAQLRSRREPFLFSGAYFIALGGIVLLGFAAWALLRKQLRDAQNTALLRGRRANKVAVQRFRAAKRHMAAGDRRAFYEEMLSALWGYMSDRFNIPAASLTKESVREELHRRGVAAAESERFAAIVGRCEEAQYSPVDSARMSDVYAEGVEFVSRIEAIVKR